MGKSKDEHSYLTERRLLEILEKFPHIQIAVVGDFFLDYYLVLDKALSEISLETNLEAFQVVKTRKNPGAAGSVTSILRSLDVQVSTVGFTGSDGNGFDLRSGLACSGVNIDHLLIFNDRFTSIYMKPMLLDNGVEREISRMDIKNREPLDPEKEFMLIEGIRKVIPDVHAVILIDQVEERNCGVITDKVLKEVASLADTYTQKIFIGDSRFHIRDFTNIIVKCNIKEASQALNIKGIQKDRTFTEKIGTELFNRNGKPVIITEGDEGIFVISHAGGFQIPAIKVKGPIDIVGAGDGVMASMSAALCVGASFTEAASMGALTASIIIQQIGTTGIATRKEVLARYREYFSNEFLVSCLPCFG